MSSARRMPVRLAIVSDFELVVAGVEAMLAPHRDRVVVVELPAQPWLSTGVDVVLWDSSAHPVEDGLDLRWLAGQGAVLISFDGTSDLAPSGPAITHTVSSHLSQGLTGLQLVEALEAVRYDSAVGLGESGHWPGDVHGLTRREVEMLDLIARGLSNQEIADAAYLSINSVKTHIRTAYRKLGVTRRSQAVGWVLQSGFGPGDRRHGCTTRAEPANGRDRRRLS